MSKTNMPSQLNQIDAISNNTTERLSYSVKEAAAAIGVSSRTIHAFVKDGSIKHFRMGARVLIPADVLRQFIVQRTQTQKS
jgi:excisionase family DNA binding protein